MYDMVQFLEVCEELGWDLDTDDIKHLLKHDYNYVIKANTTDGDYDTVKEALEAIDS